MTDKTTSSMIGHWPSFLVHYCCSEWMPRYDKDNCRFLIVLAEDGLVLLHPDNIPALQQEVYERGLLLVEDSGTLLSQAGYSEIIRQFMEKRGEA